MRILVCAIVLAAAVASAQPPRSAWDGLYTAGQAERGRQAYGRTCSGCHRSDLRGGDEGEPPLRGPVIAANWEGQSIAALLDLIASTMPKSNPGSLTPGTAADIVAFLLKSNGLPAGTAEIQADDEALDQIRFTVQPPAR